jgi:hypothetical protein
MIASMAKLEKGSGAAGVVPAGELIGRQILLLRGHRVMLDRHLAQMYGVPTHRLNEAVKRNQGRFPENFMFQLTPEENGFLISQIAIPKPGRGGRRTLPYAFTEQGVAMLSSVLNSDRAIQVNIAIMRAFVRIRGLVGGHKDLARKIEDLERKYAEHDEEIQVIFSAIQKLLEPPAGGQRKRIGFPAG